MPKYIIKDSILTDFDRAELLAETKKRTKERQRQAAKESRRVRVEDRRKAGLLPEKKVNKLVK